MVKVIAICGSPRVRGNTEYLLREALSVLEREGIETELVKLADLMVAPCEACNACQELKNCKIEDDFQEVFEKMEQADGILIGSPVYFGSASPQVMALLDRAGYVALKRDRSLERKVGAAVAVARRAGANFTFAQLNYFFFINGMIVPGSTYWNVAYGLGMEDVKKDEEGLRTVRNLSSNMAWLLKKLNA